ncbi:cannabinoid receptor 1-like [Acanthaster planci]|uniref:Cannabinoid receptor 1-like n=1 Tax=Acanthaster planci TaxID=133434 RepID=A0A8B7XJ45_ACAPL|nr:cannabinoid receptor 1-like [Acanthaster planci]
MSEEFITGVKYALTICAALAAMLNLLVLAVFVRTRSLRMKHYGFLINLTLADLFYAVMAIAYTWAESEVVFVIFFSGYFVGVWTILAEAINRYLAVSLWTRQASYHALVSKSRLLVVCVFIWVVSFAVEILPAFLANADVYAVIEGVVKPAVVFLFWLITAVLYVIVFRKIRPVHAAFESTSPLQPSEEQARLRMSQIQLLLVTFSLILVTSFVCWMPFSVIQLVQFLHGDLKNLEAAYWMSGTVYCLAPLINPCIYWLRLAGFREGFRKLFCGCLTQEPSPILEAEHSTLDGDL